MSKKDVVALVSADFIVAIICIVLFSPGLVGFPRGITNDLILALLWAFIIVLIVGAVYFNLKLTVLNTTREKKYKAEEIKTLDDIEELLINNKYKKSFTKSINTLLDTLKEFEATKGNIESTLNMKFDESSLSYAKFNNVLIATEKVFTNTMRGIALRINNFDEKIYNVALNKNNEVEEGYKERLELYKNYLKEIDEMVKSVSVIMLKLLSCSLELSRLDNFGESAIDDIIELQQLDDLIKTIKYYK
ncbi:hypothetical protein D3C81_07940 [compost metagenome]